jgi:hypothetical protein
MYFATMQVYKGGEANTMLTLNQISILIFFNLPCVYESFILFYKNKFQFSIETYVKFRRLVLASPPLYTCIVAKYIIYLYEL